MSPSILRRAWWCIRWWLLLPITLPAFIVGRLFRRHGTTTLPQHDGGGSIIQVMPKQVPADCEIEPGDDESVAKISEVIDTSKVKWYADPINTLDTLHIERILRGIKRGYWSTSSKPATASTEQRKALEQELQHRKTKAVEKVLPGELHG